MGLGLEAEREKESKCSVATCRVPVSWSVLMGQDCQKKVKLDHSIGSQGPVRAKMTAPYSCSEPRRKVFVDSFTKQMFGLKVREQGMTMLWWREQLGQRLGATESLTCEKRQVIEKSRALELQAWVDGGGE